MSNRPVLLLLDTSAILDYTRQSIHVGEVMTEVTNDGGMVGLPVLCLVEAKRASASTDLLDLLVAHQATTVLPVAADTWQALAVTYDTVGRLDLAAAVLAATETGGFILTAQPQLYAGLEDGGPIIPIPPS